MQGWLNFINILGQDKTSINAVRDFLKNSTFFLDLKCFKHSLPHYDNNFIYFKSKASLLMEKILEPPFLM